MTFVDYKGMSFMLFVAYEVCRPMTFVSYKGLPPHDVCRLQGLSPFDVCRFLGGFLVCRFGLPQYRWRVRRKTKIAILIDCMCNLKIKTETLQRAFEKLFIAFYIY